MRSVLVVLLAVHGLIHVLGFAAAFELAPLPALRGLAPPATPPATARAQGVMWLAAGLLLVLAAVAAAAGNPAWWIIAALGLVMSQGLIVAAWTEAKVGTVANALLVIPIVLGATSARFEARTATLFTDLARDAARAEAPIVLAQDLTRLPPPVARWLAGAGVVGRPRATAVHLTQDGALRTAPDGAWMRCRAEQQFRADTPEFVWGVRTRMFGLPVSGRDELMAGRGRMTITIGGAVRVVDAAGERIDQGTLLRYLGELVWFPSAALADFVRWEPVSDTSARATLTAGGVSGSALFEFDAEGRVTQVSARRYKGDGPDATLETWVVPITAWSTFDGVLVPSAGTVVWKLAEGDFEYFRWTITGVTYSPAPAAATTPDRVAVAR